MIRPMVEPLHKSHEETTQSLNTEGYIVAQDGMMID